MKIKVVIDDPLTEKLNNPLKKNLDDLVKSTFEIVKKELINKRPKNKTMKEDYNERFSKGFKSLPAFRLEENRNKSYSKIRWSK